MSITRQAVIISIILVSGFSCGKPNSKKTVVDEVTSNSAWESISTVNSPKFIFFKFCALDRHGNAFMAGKGFLRQQV
jgi:hypothetical protein